MSADHVAAPREELQSVWYVLRSMPQHERRLARYFDRRGLEYFLPQVRRRRRWSDRIRMVDFPLFPGYIFVHIDLSKQRVAALSGPGALDFVRGEGGPAMMSAEEIENIRLLSNGAQELENQPDQQFPEGAAVLVASGSLKGVHGVVVKSAGKARIYVRVPLLGRMVSAEIDAADLRIEA
ncbi:MAG: UpxY family transcription antiterminator [Leptospirales bacterium]|nr:UpxY family transcription antiterminator [Leptospirales bacterium]